MKTNEELRLTASTSSQVVFDAIHKGNSVTIEQLSNLETHSRLVHATITELKRRVKGGEIPKEGN